MQKSTFGLGATKTPIEPFTSAYNPNEANAKR
jgi:hypothetical protein